MFLKMMATKSYIMGCYQAMIETKGLRDCQCPPVRVVTHPRGYNQDTWRSESLFFQTIVKKVKNDHQCPTSSDFMPNFMDCIDHVECNDPISR